MTPESWVRLAIAAGIAVPVLIGAVLWQRHLDRKQK